MFCYLADCLIVADSPRRLIAHRDLTLSVLNLGFLINWEKSALTPTQIPVFLGAGIVIPGQLARPSPDRVGTILAAARSLRNRHVAPARTWLQFLGYLASLVDVLPDCRLYIRPLQIHLQVYQPNLDPLSKPVSVTDLIRPHLARWMQRPFLTQGKHLKPPQPSVKVMTDASLLGWGAVCQGRMLSWDWSHLPLLPHINRLDFRAVMLACRQLQPMLTGKTILTQTDNIIVASYINKQGGTHSQPHSSRGPILELVPVEGHTSHCLIPTGAQESCGRPLSRGRHLPSEWMLHPQVFNLIQATLGPLQVDLFASSLYFQLPHYCARSRDPGAWKTDVFSFHWGSLRGYAIPPISLIPRVLRKIREDQASVLLIAPRWPRRPWFLERMDLLAGHPRTLPIRSGLIRQPVSGECHEIPNLLHLTAWPLSGKRV